MRLLAAAAMAAVLPALGLRAMSSFSLSNTFGNHMTLQHGSQIPVWGWGEPGASVTVSVGTSSGSTVSSSDGFWRVALAPLPPSFTPTTLNATCTTTGESVQLTDILIGDVFFCSGQSNMEFTWVYYFRVYRVAKLV